MDFQRKSTLLVQRPEVGELGRSKSEARPGWPEGGEQGVGGRDYVGEMSRDRSSGPRKGVRISL